jgi:hypothetical protein
MFSDEGISQVGIKLPPFAESPCQDGVNVEIRLS